MGCRNTGRLTVLPGEQQVKNESTYLEMQKNQYEHEASLWSFESKNYVVGSYDEHNAWVDYDTHLFKNFSTEHLEGLEYGCGPGRNLVRFNSRFKSLDGCDIALNNVSKAHLNLQHSGVKNYSLYVCDGKSVPVKSNTYDVVFSVICLQHVASYSVRFSIFKDVYRVLKSGGYFCFQMGYGSKKNFTTASYYEDKYDATGTNGSCDVTVESESYLVDDLTSKLQFKNYTSDVRPVGPGDYHENWIWVQVQK